MSRPSVPPFWLRLSVVVGACALVLGIAGAILLIVNNEGAQPAYGAGLCPRLQIEGLDGTWPEDMAVSVAWHEEGEATDVQQTALPLAGSPGTFLLPPDACDRRVVIEILDTRSDPPTSLGRHEVDVRRGEDVTLDVSDPGTPR